MIHDQSNTGSTVFIEPLSVVQLNNKIKELQSDEKKEIEKILAELSALVAEQKEVLEADIEILIHLDFVFAKANLSLSMNGTQPLFNIRGYINIQKARHPLLDDKTVVPINIYWTEYRRKNSCFKNIRTIYTNGTIWTAYTCIRPFSTCCI